MQEINEKQKNRQTGFSRWIRPGLIAVFSCMLIAGLAILIRYGIDLVNLNQTEAELNALYHGSTEEKQAAVKTDIPEKTENAQETPLPDRNGTEEPVSETDNAEAMAIPEPDTEEKPELSVGAAELNPVPYPDNPEKIPAGRFRMLLEKNPDIVGWLDLNGLLETAVVRRDNIYYMTHDALNKENMNGAIFMDAAVSLDTRPYTLLLYGHNMKSGKMFGCLRNYEDLSFYKRNPFLTFDSLYEEGRYVIFAAGRISLEASGEHYLDPFKMLSVSTEERQEMIGKLKSSSVLLCGVDVLPEDQLLILVTCVDQDEYRRVVAARRIRNGETEEELRQLIQDTATKNANK